MKTKSIFKVLFMSFFVACLTLMGCSSDESGGEATTTSITLTSNTESILEGQSVTFNVKDNLNNNVTGNSTFKIGSETITNPYTFDVAGVYEVVATYNSLTSSALTITVAVPPQATSIVLAPSSVNACSNEEVTFTVTDDLNNQVADLSELKVNGVVISNPYTFPTSGSYTVVATYQDLTSNEVVISVMQAPIFSDVSMFSASGAPTTFTKKALLEDFTGTWCPNCPPAGAAIANAISSNSNIFGVGYHDGDPMQTSETSYWSNYYNVTGFPTVYVNGPDTRWEYDSMDQVNAELAEEASVGLAVEASMSCGKINIEVKVGYKSAINEQIKLMVYLMEDDVTSASAQQGSSQGTSYVHKDVLREVYTDQLGDVISTSDIGVGGVYTRTFTGLEMPSTIDDVSNLKVVAYVRNTYTKTFTDYFGTVHTNSPHYDIYNVQEVHVGSSQDFD